VVSANGACAGASFAEGRIVCRKKYAAAAAMAASNRRFVNNFIQPWVNSTGSPIDHPDADDSLSNEWPDAVRPLNGVGGRIAFSNSRIVTTDQFDVMI
jgi:hypothetical protein